MSLLIFAVLQVSNPLDVGTFTSGLLGAILGFATALAVFRSRFTAVEKDIQHLKESVDDKLQHIREDNERAWENIRADVQRLCRNDDAYWKDSERRQKFIVDGIAALMRQGGVSHRVTDAAARLLEGESRDT